MTVYWFTIGTISYLLLMTRQLDRGLDERPMGSLQMMASSRIGLGLAALVLLIVAALRWEVGTDFYQYVLNYDAYKASFFADLQTFREPGIKALALIVSLFRDDPAVFMIVASAITTGLMLWTITKYSTAVAMSVLLFIFVGTWHGSFNGVRQFLACAVIFAGHRFIVQRRPALYALVVVLAASFHVSALAMAILYFVPSKQLSKRMVLLLGLMALVALYASDAALGLVEIVTDEEVVLTEYVVRSINPLRVAVAAAPVLLYWAHGVRTEADGEWFYKNMAVVHAAVILAASWSAYLTRFGIYTTAFLPLVLPRLIDFSDRRLTAITRVVVTLLFAAYWYTEVSGSETLNNFKFIWERTR